MQYELFIFSYCSFLFNITCVNMLGGNISIFFITRSLPNVIIKIKVISICLTRKDLVLVQCSPPPHESVSAFVTYTLLNPGGEQLPLGEIPLPNIYVSFSMPLPPLPSISFTLVTKFDSSISHHFPFLCTSLFSPSSPFEISITSYFSIKATFTFHIY